MEASTRCAASQDKQGQVLMLSELWHFLPENPRTCKEYKIIAGQRTRLLITVTDYTSAGHRSWRHRSRGEFPEEHSTNVSSGRRSWREGSWDSFQLVPAGSISAAFHDQQFPSTRWTRCQRSRTNSHTCASHAHSALLFL
jgi:hypothetical protein